MPTQKPSPFDSLRQNRLHWLPEHGIGYYEVEGEPYDAAYFERYRAMAGTEMGAALTQARVAFVRNWWAGPVVDVGIGSGQFAEALDCQGFDVNPAGVAWLQAAGRYADPYAGCEAVTCWDSLEHIREPGALLAKVRRWVFVSIPIFASGEHAAGSKHFRPDEHYWYFTGPGLVRFMFSHGFQVREADNFETLLGREDIGTFAFERVA